MLNLNSRKDLRIALLSVVAIFALVVVLFAVRPTSSNRESSTVYAAGNSQPNYSQEEKANDKVYRATMARSPNRHKIFEAAVRSTTSYGGLARLVRWCQTKEERWEVMDKEVKAPDLDRSDLGAVKTDLLSMRTMYNQQIGYKFYDPAKWQKDLAIVNSRIAAMQQQDQ